MLYRFREAQAAELGLGKTRLRRPGFAGSVNTVAEAEKWRRDLLSEVSRKISKIQDGEFLLGQLAHTPVLTAYYV